MNSIAIIVPCLNEEASIGAVLHSLLFLDLDSEIVVVDNASTDRTVKIAEKLPVKVVRHPRNLGLGSSIRTGLRLTTGEIVVVQHADGEYAVDYLPEYLRALENGADAVFGSRFLGSIENMSLSHYLANRFLSLLMSLLFRTKLSDVLTGAKVFRRSLVDIGDLRSNNFEIEVELTSEILRNRGKIVEIPIKYRRRDKGKAKIRWSDGVRLLFRILRCRPRHEKIDSQ